MKKLYLLLTILIFLLFSQDVFCQAPPNNLCTTAEVIPIFPGVCGSFTTGNNTNATNSGETPSPTCGNYQGYDIWYEVVVPATGEVSIDLNNLSWSTTAGVLYSGTCGNLSQVGPCTASNSAWPIDYTGLTPGSHYLRVYDFSGNDFGPVGVCVTTPIPPPSNDACATADSVAVNPDQSCAISYPGTTDGATLTETGCPSSSTTDIWYKFVATNTNHVISYMNIVSTTGSITDVYTELFSNVCGSLTSIKCTSSSAPEFTGLTIGTSYYIKVSPYNSSVSVAFDFCIGTPPPPPANDICSGAFVLPVQPNSCSMWTTVDNSGTTDSGAGAPSCGFYQGGDLWYEVTVPASGNITFDVQNVNWFSAAAALYSGTCSTLFEEDCKQNPGVGWPFVFTSIPPGVYYLRIWEYGNSSATTAELCAFATTCLISNVTAGTQSACDPITGTYSQDLIVTYVDAPSSGSLVVNGQSFPIGTSPQTVTLTGLPSNGNPVDVNVGFTALNTCLFTSLALYTEPSPCITNDECSGAISAVVNPDETCAMLTPGSTIGGTFSMYSSTTFCAWGNPNDDVWFSFVATSTIHNIDLLNVTSVSSSTDMVHHVYEGSCSDTLNQLHCNNNNSGTVYGLTVGNTYYVNVHSYHHQLHASQLFDLCIGTPPPAPPNDSCGGAYPLAVNPDLSCTLFSSGTTEFAYQSLSGCVGTANNDVWYSFVATSTVHLIDVFNVVGGLTDMVHEVFSGNCGNLTSLDCSDPNSNIVSGLTVGNTYFVRVYSYSSSTSASNNQTFDICVNTPPPPPPNDSCGGAVMAPVNPDQNCAMVVSGSNLSASQSMPGCVGTANDDLWFSFVATSSVHEFDLLNVSPIFGTSTSMVHEVFSGTCGSFTSLNCSSSYSSSLGGLTVGNTYYVRIYSYYTSSSQDFDFCIGTPPPPPPNDTCLGAIPLTVQANSCATMTPGDNTYATNSGELPNPTCGNYSDSDMWYEIVVPAGGTVIVDANESSSISNLSSALYSGSCGALTQVTCTEFNSQYPVTYSGLVPGDTYYLRVWDYSSNQTGTFEVCAYALICSITNLTHGDVVGCDSVGNTYDKEVGVYFTNPPSSGTLDVNGQSFPITGVGFQWVTLTGLPINGPPVDVTATFSADTACTYGETALFAAMPICAPPPPNDLCEDAIPLDSCIIGDNSTATSGSNFNPGCGNYVGGDLWYDVIVPPSGNYTVDFPNLTWSDIAIEIINGGCFSESYSYCRDTTTGPPFHFSGLSPGPHTLRVWNPGHDEFGPIEICVYEPIPCTIDSVIVGMQAPCDSLAGTYSQDLIVYYDNLTVPGDIWVNGQLFPVTTSPQTITLTNLPANGQPVAVEVYGEGPVDCEFLELGMFTGPDCSLSSQCGPYSSTNPTIVVAGTDSVITDLNVLIEFDADYVDYFQFVLQSPSGTQVTLWNYQCGGYSDFEVLFDDEGMPVNCSSLVGVYIPFQSLSQFDGELFDGTWTLIVGAVEVPPQNLQWCIIPELAPASPTDNCGDHTSSTGNIIPASGMYTETIMVAGAGDSLADLNLIVNIDDTFSNYEIELTSPAGTVVSVYSAQCLMTEDLEVEFDDEATMAITCGSPTSGNYLPVNSLSAFDGEEFNGLWEIKITNFGTTAATLEQWCLIPEINDACEYSSAPGSIIGANGLDDVMSIAGTGLYANNISVLVEIDHPDVGALGVALIDPFGNWIMLKNIGICGGAVNLNAEFSDAGSPITCGSPTSGIFLPDNPLSISNGVPLDGDWTLSLFDASGSGQGTLVKWCIIPEPPKDCDYTSIPGKEIDDDPNGPGSGGGPINVFGPPVVCDTISVSGTGGLLADLNVYVEIAHSYMSDLDIVLISPLGDTVDLFLGNCDDEDYMEIEFDDEGAPLFCQATIAGNYFPDGSLSDFDGILFDGDWILKIEDMYPGVDEGVLVQWCLLPRFVKTCDYTSVPAKPIDDDPYYGTGNPGPPIVYDTISVTGTGGLLADLNVLTDIDHMWLEDLDIKITSPSGTTVPLMFMQCGGEANMEVEFDDEGTPMLCATPTIGVFQPIGSLSDFIGEPFDGDWILIVEDIYTGYDVGLLNRWCLFPEFLDSCDYTSAPGKEIDVDGIGPPIDFFGPPIVCDTISISGTTGVLTDLNAFVKINHQHLAELDILLISPAGDSVALILGSCVFEEDMEIEFDDEGVPLVCASPTVGNYQPAELLSEFDGQSFNGDWILKIEDTFPGANAGVLVQWCLFPEMMPACTLDSIVSTDVSCNGLSDGTGTVYTTGGTPPYTYTWDNGETTSPAVGLSAGTHVVTIVDMDGCTLIDSVLISEPMALGAASVSSTGVSCNGSIDGTATITVTGGTPNYTYAWDNGETTATATGLSAGSHSVTVVDMNGCTLVEDMIQITEPMAIAVASITSTGVTCNGLSDGTATITVTGGSPAYTYTWDNGETSMTATGLTAGTHSVTVVDMNGCALNVNTIEIAAPMVLGAASITSTGVTCNGLSDGTATITVTGGTPAYTYTWDNGETSATATGLSAGMHSVTVVDMNGCALNVGSIEITAPMVLGAASITSTGVSCNGLSDGTATVTVTGGAPAYTYTWDNGETSMTATGLSAGTHSVTVVDMNGCALNIDTIEIAAPMVLGAASITSTGVTCNGLSDGTATISVTGGTPAYTYTWDNGETSATATGLSAGMHSVTVVDMNGCALNVGSIEILTPMSMGAASITSTGVSCNGLSDGTATITVTGGTPAYTYTWDNGETTPTATGLSAGIHSVTVVDMNGCALNIGSVEITAPVAIEVSVVSTGVACHGVDDGTATATVSGGTPAFTYTWNNGGSTSAITGLAPGMYTVTVVDANGCSAIGTVQVADPTGPAMFVFIDTDEVSCGGLTDGAATVTPSYGTAPYMYQWDANAGSQTTPTATGLALGTYMITVTDANGCYLVDGVLIDEAPCDFCQLAEDNNWNICAVLSAGPSHPLSTLDCDGDGVLNAAECNDGTNPSDPCFFDDGSITEPVTADQTDCYNLCPDLTVVTTLLPNNIIGASAISLRINITELNGEDAGPAPITVRMPSDPRLTFNWNAAANPGWLYGGNNGLFHVFTFIGNSGVFIGGTTQAIIIGIAEMTYDPQGTDGITSISPSIVPFSGGECTVDNNTDPETLVYFK